MSWRVIGGLTVVSLASLGLAYSYTQYQHEKKERAKSRAQRKIDRENKIKDKKARREANRGKNASSASAASPSSAADASSSSSSSSASHVSSPSHHRQKKKKLDFPDDDTLVDRARQSIQALSQGRPNLSHDNDLKEIILNLNPANYQSNTRLSAAQWLTVQCQLAQQEAQAREEPSELKAAKAEMSEVMEVAWKLLDCSFTNDEEERQVDILRLDMAQKMQSASKILTCYQRIFNRGEGMLDDEKIMLFTVAPLLGRWKDFFIIGEELQSKGNDFKEFHEASLQRPELPDYDVLFSISQEASKGEDTPLEDLQWGNGRILTQRLKRKPGQVEEENDASLEWQEVETTAHTNKVLRFGALVQMMNLFSISGFPLLLVGPASQTTMHAQGYVEAEAEGGMRRQTEIVLLTKDTEGEDNKWSGTYSLIISNPANPDDVPKATEFDLEMTFSALDD